MSYRCQISTDSSFSITMVDLTVTDTVITYMPNVDTCTYFVRVEANGADGSSGFSPISMIRVLIPKVNSVGGASNQWGLSSL